MQLRVTSSEGGPAPLRTRRISCAGKAGSRTSINIAALPEVLARWWLSRDDRGRDLLLVAALLANAAPRDLAAPPDPLGRERRRAPGTGLPHRARPKRELASRVVRAREEGLAALGAPLHELPSAARLGTVDAERQGLGRLAVGIARAGDELAEPSVLDHHRLPARRAGLVRRLVGRLLASATQVLGVLALRVGRAGEEAAEAPELLHERLAALGAGLAGLGPRLDVLHRLAGALEVPRELLVERLHGVHPVGVAVLDLVE